MTDEATPNKGGRPRIDLTDEEVAIVEKVAPVLTQEQIADLLGISERTLRNRIRDDERVAAAYARGRARAVEEVGSELLKFARGKKGDERAQLDALKFFLLSQGGWRVSQKHEVSGPNDGPIPVNLEDNRESLARRIAGVAARLGTGGDPSGS